MTGCHLQTLIIPLWPKQPHPSPVLYLKLHLCPHLRSHLCPHLHSYLCPPPHSSYCMAGARVQERRERWRNTPLSRSFVAGEIDNKCDTWIIIHFAQHIKQ